jgi:hypothetical protein
MDHQATGMEQIGCYVAERYPMYATDTGFEQWLYAKAGLSREMIDRYLALLESYGYISSDGKLAGDYRSLPDPDRVTQDIERRLAGLSPGAIDALRVASVEGDRFSPEILEQLRDTSDSPERLLESAVRAGVIAPEPNASTVPALAHRYRFVPLLARSVLYEQLTPGERLRLHARLVEILSAETESVTDPGALDMLHHLISEHNKVVARPDPPPSKS